TGTGSPGITRLGRNRRRNGSQAIGHSSPAAPGCGSRAAGPESRTLALRESPALRAGLFSSAIVLVRAEVSAARAASACAARKNTIPTTSGGDRMTFGRSFRRVLAVLPFCAALIGLGGGASAQGTARPMDQGLQLLGSEPSYLDLAAGAFDIQG